jgi:hypothetical protein
LEQNAERNSNRPAESPGVSPDSAAESPGVSPGVYTPGVYTPGVYTPEVQYIDRDLQKRNLPIEQPDRNYIERNMEKRNLPIEQPHKLRAGVTPVINKQAEILRAIKVKEKKVLNRATGTGPLQRPRGSRKSETGGASSPTGSTVTSDASERVL